MIQVCRNCGIRAGGLISHDPAIQALAERWPEPDLCPRCTAGGGKQTCTTCGRGEPEVSFDADTFAGDCDECVGFRTAFSRAYAEMDRHRGFF